MTIKSVMNKVKSISRSPSKSISKKNNNISNNFNGFNGFNGFNNLNNNNNSNNKSSHNVEIFYYLIMTSIMLKCVSYIPFIVKIYDTHLTTNIPYTTLFLELVAYLIIIAVAISKRYFVQALFFAIFIASVLYILFLKIKHEKEENY
jgi:hypothetical protein